MCNFCTIRKSLRLGKNNEGKKCVLKRKCKRGHREMNINLLTIVLERMNEACMF